MKTRGRSSSSNNSASSSSDSNDSSISSNSSDSSASNGHKSHKHVSKAAKEKQVDGESSSLDMKKKTKGDVVRKHSNKSEDKLQHRSEDVHKKKCNEYDESDQNPVSKRQEDDKYYKHERRYTDDGDRNCRRDRRVDYESKHNDQDKSHKRERRDESDRDNRHDVGDHRYKREKRDDNDASEHHRYDRRNDDDRRHEDYRGDKRNEDVHSYDRRGRRDDGGRDRRDNHRIPLSKNRRGRSPSFDHTNAKWGKGDHHEPNRNKDGKPVNKEKPNFGLSGKLTEETNTYRGVVIKYSEPPEARKPKRRWRLYPFKGEKALQTLYIHRESAYLIGRERKVVDLPVDHPSCSKQHAALQYRLVPFTREDGSAGKRVRPYLIDLDSANGTFINNKKIEHRKYVELLEKDVIKFGFSSREYVLLHENSKDEAQDDDVKQEDDEAPVKKEKDD